MALDRSEIFADAGGVAVAVAIAGGGGGSLAGTVGVGNSENTLNNTAKAFIDTAVVTAGGALSILAKADDRPGSGRDFRIDALAVAAAAAVGGSGSGGAGLAGSGAGAEVTNSINNVIEAFIRGSSSVTADSFVLEARDDSSIRGDTGGFAIASAGSTGGGAGGLSVGASQSINDIGQGNGHRILAYIEDSTAQSAGDIDILADFVGDVRALAMGGSLAGAGSTGLNGAFAGAGAGTQNKVKVTTGALIDSSSVVAAVSGDVTLSSEDDTKVVADSGGVAVAIAFGSGSSNGLSVGVGVADNQIQNTTYSAIHESTVEAVGVIDLDADSDAEIEALSFGGSASVSADAGNANALAAAGGVAKNKLDNVIESRVGDIDLGLTRLQATNGSITLDAIDRAVVGSDSGGGSVALAGSGSGGISLGVAFVEANNDIDNKVSSVIENADILTVDSAADIEVKAYSHSRIHSNAVAVTVSGNASPAGFGFAGGGAGATNDIQNVIVAHVIDGTQSAADSVDDLRAGDRIVVLAGDDSSISSDVGAGALSFGAGGASIGVSLNSNTVDNAVSAYRCTG